LWINIAADWTRAKSPISRARKIVRADMGGLRSRPDGAGALGRRALGDGEIQLRRGKVPCALVPACFPPVFRLIRRPGLLHGTIRNHQIRQSLRCAGWRPSAAPCLYFRCYLQRPAAVQQTGLGSDAVPLSIRTAINRNLQAMASVSAALAALGSSCGAPFPLARSHRLIPFGVFSIRNILLGISSQAFSHIRGRRRDRLG
jgi:hypothetical protein